MDLSRLVFSVELFYLLCLCYFCTFVAFGEEHSHTVTTRQRWEVYAIKELISGKDEFLTCPTREYRLQDPDTISFLDRKRDDSKVTSVLEMVPPQFLPNYKNPCWYECLETDHPYTDNVYQDHADEGFRQHFAFMEKFFEERLARGEKWRLRCLPYFYIVGQPKCGTTDLFYKISLHPDVLMGPIKEPQFWTRRRIYNIESPGDHNQIAKFTDFADIFDLPAENIRRHLIQLEAENVPRHQKIIGDGTTSTFWENYLWHMEVENHELPEPTHIIANYIAHVQPDAKLILLLRDPVDRMYSSYNYFGTFEKSPQDFHERTVDRIARETQCAEEHSWRYCIYDHTMRLFPPFDLEVGLYDIFLEDWLKVYPIENFLVLRTEDFKTHTAEVLVQAFRFLDVEPLHHEDLEIIMTSHIYEQATSGTVKREPMLEETKQILYDFYRPHCERLAELLGDDKFLWDDVR